MADLDLSTGCAGSRQLAAALEALQLPAVSHIALFSKNCAHWIICDLAIMMAAMYQFPLSKSARGNCSAILERSESVVLFVGKIDQWGAIKMEYLRISNALLFLL
jgi:long-chain acyl-CoA synthetase